MISVFVVDGGQILLEMGQARYVPLPFILAPVTKGTHALSQSCCLSSMSWIRHSSICLSLQVRDPGSGL